MQQDTLNFLVYLTFLVIVIVCMIGLLGYYAAAVIQFCKEGRERLNRYNEAQSKTNLAQVINLDDHRVARIHSAV